MVATASLAAGKLSGHRAALPAAAATLATAVIACSVDWSTFMQLCTKPA